MYIYIHICFAFLKTVHSFDTSNRYSTNLMTVYTFTCNIILGVGCVGFCVQGTSTIAIVSRSHKVQKLMEIKMGSPPQIN